MTRTADQDPSAAERVLLRDVADAAGVALSTASRAFTQPDRVNFQTVEHIMAVAARLGYRREPARVTPARTMSRTLYLLVQDSANPFFTDLVKGVVRQAKAAGYLAVVGDAEETPAMEQVLIERVSRAVDGIITSARSTSDTEMRELARHQPLVMFNREVVGVSSVIAGTSESSHQLIEHLHALGHRRVVYCAGPNNSWTNLQRWRALHHGARKLGMTIIRTGPFSPNYDQGPVAGEIAAAHRPTAIVAFNDQLAIGMIRHFVRRGVQVPEDLSITGYDNTYGASFVHSGLTCLDAPVEEAGRAAVDLLLTQIGGDTRPRTIRLPSPLRVRGSTGPAPAG
ncbi:LacI family DNA-binding transcriptional regulator [Citricoccus muralis]|uniref:LacI family DNA-binding transcriptional regulator n=1 Tax=Citricoccus muralis TaxID=169134 RepID=A0ABY8H9Z6_9MICC|nr:LacI family DNA-binding transcriptional regulator [Citricoccus muralis]WFP17669.1 LacI family DNA-binding transcriptional regulator [Citricoccus muralis]